MRPTVNVANIDSAMRPTPGEPEQLLDVGASVTQFTTFDDNSEAIFISLEGGNIRCRLDGTDPDGSTGHLIYAGSSFVWSKTTAQIAKFFRAGGTNGKVRGTPMSSR